jgi:hypothetical protein
VALIEDGKVVAIGRHDDLLTSEPRYAAALSAARTPKPAARKPDAARARMLGGPAAPGAPAGEGGLGGLPPGLVGPGALGGLGV